MRRGAGSLEHPGARLPRTYESLCHHRRVLLVIPTLFILTIVVFLSVSLIPGDIIDAMGADLQDQRGFDRAALERRLGLDVPVPVQYGRWIGGIFLRGTLGESLWSDSPVEELLRDGLPVTLGLGLPGDSHRARASAAGRHLFGNSSGYRHRLRGALGRHHRPCHAQLLDSSHGLALSGHLVGLGRRHCSGCRSPKTRWGISGC